MNTDEVKAAIAEHLRLVEEHKALVEQAELEAAAEEAPAERRKRQVFYTAGAFPAAIPIAPAHQVVHHPEFYSGLEVAPVDLSPADDAEVAPGPIAPVVTDGE